jgi:hypothetical protein
MIALASDRRKTLGLVQQVSFAGRGRVSAPVFLARVCGIVSEAFEFDFVNAALFHPGAAEVSDVVVAGAPAQRAERRPIADAPLLAPGAGELEARPHLQRRPRRHHVGVRPTMLGVEQCLGFPAPAGARSRPTRAGRTRSRPSESSPQPCSTAHSLRRRRSSSGC